MTVLQHLDSANSLAWTYKLMTWQGPLNAHAVQADCGLRSVSVHFVDGRCSTTAIYEVQPR